MPGAFRRLVGVVAVASVSQRRKEDIDIRNLTPFFSPENQTVRTDPF
jgi:hypothetical protein